MTTKSSNLPVLTYHSFTTDEHKVNSVTVTAEKIEQDLKYLKDKGYTTVLPKDLLDKRGKYIRRPIMITVDYGYLDNYTILFPL